MRKKSKWITFTLLAVLVCALLAGCMNTGSRVTPDMENSAQPSAQSTQDNSLMSDVNQGISDAFDWLTMGAGVEEKIGMLSEIDSARVIVNGGTALVGVTFANAYQGEMTQRIHDMVAGEVQSADAAVQTVAVTAEQEDVQKINEMADRIAAGTPVSELEDEIDAIIRNVTTVQ